VTASNATSAWWSLDSPLRCQPRQEEQIFNAFFTTKVHGTVMGLRLSRSVVEAHAGRLWAADNSLRGACFCFALPNNARADE
jgi:signal transduction histidine kinase